MIIVLVLRYDLHDRGPLLFGSAGMRDAERAEAAQREHIRTRFLAHRGRRFISLGGRMRLERHLSGPMPSVPDHGSDAIFGQIIHPIDNSFDSSRRGPIDMYKALQCRGVRAHTQLPQERGEFSGTINGGCS